jgi:hypothetical protein
VRPRHAGLSPMLAVALAGAPAYAAPDRAPNPCLTSPVEGQKLRKVDQLLSARDRFTVCARNTCPSEIVRDCVQWLGEVDAAIPSVVLAARDASGRDLLDVHISIDGNPSVNANQRAIELDPGIRRFVFQKEGSPDVSLQVLLREGEKNREVVATFAAPPAPPESTRLLPSPRPAPVLERQMPVAAWVLGGVGVAALGSFGAFAGIGLSERQNDHCDSGCSSSQKADVETKYQVADVSLGVAVVALGIATWVYFAHPKVARAGPAQGEVGGTSNGAVMLSF